jgi:hypothetical protein
MGFEYIPNELFLVNPDLHFTLNDSNDRPNKFYHYGPSLYLAVTPHPRWEHFLGLAYSFASYSGSPYSFTEKEYQELTVVEIGSLYRFTDKFSLQMLFSSNKNSSNNFDSTYKVDILSANIGYKF